MITAPSESMPLSLAQLKQLDVFEKRLANLQEEVASTRKELIAIREETKIAVKERDYQQELLVADKERTAEAEANLGLVKDQVLRVEKEFSSKVEAMDLLGIENKKKASELAEREKVLTSSEEEYGKRLAKFNVESKQLSEDKIAMQASMEAFLRAIESVTWK